MAVLTSRGIADVGVALLVRQLTLPRTVTRVPSSGFTGGNGDTITIRVPQPGVVRVQENPGDALIPDDVNEVPVDVKLRHLYNLKNLTDQELTFNLRDFAAQVTRVQMEAVASGAEDEIATAMNDLDGDLDLELDGSDIEDTILEARLLLGNAKVPATDRFLAVSPEVANMILILDKFSRVDASGTDDALRRAIIGSIYGFTVVESVALDAGTAVAYHRSGFGYASVTPATPRGAVDTATSERDGIGIRHIFQYDAGHAQDQSLVSTFAGAAAVADDASGLTYPRIVKIETGAT